MKCVLLGQVHMLLSRVKSPFLSLIFLSVGSFSWSQALASDPATKLQLGERVAQSLCLACHGPQGISVNPMWPSLAGQGESYLIKAITDYRTGARQDPLMTPQSMTLSEYEIEAVAAYYSSLKVELKNKAAGAEQ